METHCPSLWYQLKISLKVDNGLFGLLTELFSVHSITSEVWHIVNVKSHDSLTIFLIRATRLCVFCHYGMLSSVVFISHLCWRPVELGTISAGSMNSISRVQGQKTSMERGNKTSAKPNPTRATRSNRLPCFPHPARVQERLVFHQEDENGGTVTALQYTNKSLCCDPAGETQETNSHKPEVFALCFMPNQS